MNRHKQVGQNPLAGPELIGNRPTQKPLHQRRIWVAVPMDLEAESPTRGQFISVSEADRTNSVVRWALCDVAALHDPKLWVDGEPLWVANSYE
jgi:hypothetical protein